MIPVDICSNFSAEEGTNGKRILATTSNATGSIGPYGTTHNATNDATSNASCNGGHNGQPDDDGWNDASNGNCS